MYDPPTPQDICARVGEPCTVKTHRMFEPVQIIHPAQLCPNVFHWHFESGIAVYRIMDCQNVYMAMNPYGSGAHYGTKEGDFAFCSVEEIYGVGRHRSFFCFFPGARVGPWNLELWDGGGRKAGLFEGCQN